MRGSLAPGTHRGHTGDTLGTHPLTVRFLWVSKEKHRMKLMVQLQLGTQLSVLCKTVASLEQWSREPRWCKEPEKEQPVVLLEHLLTTGMGTKGGRTHSRPEACLPNGHQCGILLLPPVLSWSNTQQQHDVLSGAEKGFSSWELGWGWGHWMGTSALGSHLKSHLIAWGKHLGCTPQTTRGAISGERLGKLKRKEEEWM